VSCGLSHDNPPRRQPTLTPEPWQRWLNSLTNPEARLAIGRREPINFTKFWCAMAALAERCVGPPNPHCYLKFLIEPTGFAILSGFGQ
jgi:hypothetical protein